MEIGRGPLWHYYYNIMFDIIIIIIIFLLFRTRIVAHSAVLANNATVISSFLFQRHLIIFGFQTLSTRSIKSRCVCYFSIIHIFLCEMARRQFNTINAEFWYCYNNKYYYLVTRSYFYLVFMRVASFDNWYWKNKILLDFNRILCVL